PLRHSSVSSYRHHRHLHSFPTRRSSDLSREADARVRSGGESETAEEHVVVDGRRRTLLLTRSPLRDHDGRIIGVLGVARDVTEQDRKSTRLNSSHLGISYAVFCLKKKNK